jgi:hypothetical protein
VAYVPAPPFCPLHGQVIQERGQVGRSRATGQRQEGRHGRARNDRGLGDRCKSDRGGGDWGRGGRAGELHNGAATPHAGSAVGWVDQYSASHNLIGATSPLMCHTPNTSCWCTTQVTTGRWARQMSLHTHLTRYTSVLELDRASGSTTPTLRYSVESCTKASTPRHN